ncbi:TlpA disulfide reductase family protein [Dokdonia sinensis]|nr:TlpA disulfide reductase family protein [Dokdonia sinensis]
MNYLRHLFLPVLVLLLFSCKSDKMENEPSLTQKTVIEGTIKNGKFSEYGTTIHLSYPNYIAGDYVEETAVIDSLTGQFTFELNTTVPQQVYVYHNQGFELFITPGETVTVNFDNSFNEEEVFKENIDFKGANAADNRMLLNYKSLFPEDYTRNETIIRSGKPEAYKNYLDSLYIVKDTKIDAFIKENNPSPFFKNWLETEKKFAKNAKLLAYIPLHNMFTRQFVKVDDNFFKEAMTPVSFTEKDLVNNTLSSDYIRYYGYQINTDIQNALSPEELKRPEKRDSVYFKKIDAVASKNKLLAQLVANQYVQGMLSNNSVTYYEKHRGKFDTLFSESIFEKSLARKYGSVKDLLDNPVLPEGSELLSFKSENSEDFIQEIIANANGKVVFIDNWATWCGPCKQEFKEATPALKEKFEDDVEFVYLCHQSDEKLWKPSIAQYKVKGKHYFLNKEESKPIFKQINLQGFPTYTIINKKGEIVNSGFEYRPSESITTEILTKLVAE